MQLKISQIILVTLGIAFMGIISINLVHHWQSEWRFYYIHTPKGKIYNKPKELLTQTHVDSIINSKVSKERVEITGSGYSGYSFHMRHKATQPEEIYIKAFEITSNTRLSKWKLDNRTKNVIFEKSDSYQLYHGHTVIDEGTFERYYPVRFELWFRSAKDSTERKLAEKSYLIDGWDR